MKRAKWGTKRISTDKSASSYDSPAAPIMMRMWFQTNVIVDRIAETLLAPEVSLRRLNRNVT